MNVPVRPPADPLAGRSPDDLDRLLREFFRAEMPQPWPALAAPVARANGVVPSALAETPRGERHSPAARSRITLAASVMVLAGACWLASGGLHDRPAAHSGFGTDSKADTRFLDLTHFEDAPPRAPAKSADPAETSRPIPGGDPVRFP
jgi:hypothetical protein